MHMVTPWHSLSFYKVDHRTVNEVTLEVTAMQVLEKLDCNDSTVQHVVLASIPPQQPVASTPEVNLQPALHVLHPPSLRACLFPYPHLHHYCLKLDRYASDTTLYLALPACLSL